MGGLNLLDRRICGTNVELPNKMSTELPKQGADKAVRKIPKAIEGLWLFGSVALVTWFWWIRDMFLVFWVYGWDAYFHGGIRVLRGKPIMFSNGEPAPVFPDLVTGFAFFFVVVGGWAFVLIIAPDWYRRFRIKRRRRLIKERLMKAN